MPRESMPVMAGFCSRRGRDADAAWLVNERRPAPADRRWIHAQAMSWIRVSRRKSCQRVISLGC